VLTKEGTIVHSSGEPVKPFKFSFILALVVAATSLMHADEPKKIENFTLEDVNGAKHALTDYTRYKAVVLMFISTQCPVSNGYNTRMAALHNDYKDKGVVFLGINSNKSESIDEIRSHAKEHEFGFTVLKDPDNKIADKLEASVTPEIYLLNPELELLYHGRIDDNSRGTNITSHDLRKALDELLAGKSVSVSRTKAFGCTIKRVNQ
jgi:peroxiredoxin